MSLPNSARSEGNSRDMDFSTRRFAGFPWDFCYSSELDADSDQTERRIDESQGGSAPEGLTLFSVKKCIIDTI